VEWGFLDLILLKAEEIRRIFMNLLVRIFLVVFRFVQSFREDYKETLIEGTEKP
jgi:hypothetical protein